MFRIYSLLCTALLTTVSVPVSARVPTFNPVKTLTHPYTSQMITADLNGDGIPDLIETYSHSYPTFTVQIANGDGTFSRPATYKLPFELQYSAFLATADINNDGKADLLLATDTHLLVYFGRGNGRLNITPKETTLPGAVLGLAVADFNHDGNPDVAVTLFNQVAESVAVMSGDGQGAFSPPINVLSARDQGIYPMLVGDFDSDGNADIAIGLIYGPCNPSRCDHTDIHILYGSGSASFTDQLVYPGAPGFFFFSAGDVNSDGATDLMGGVDPPNQNGENWVIVYGNSTRALTTKYLTTNRPAGSGPVADFNGDGRNDVAMWSFDGPDVLIGFLLGGPDGSFRWHDIVFGGYSYEAGNLVFGDFNRDRKPDLALPANNRLGGSDRRSYVYGYLNTTAGENWSPCDYPKAAHGINVCSPLDGSTLSSTVHFKIAATWFEPLRSLQVWVDGKRITEQYHVWDKYGWLRFTGTFATGTHHADIYSAGCDNALQHQSLAFTVR